MPLPGEDGGGDAGGGIMQSWMTFYKRIGYFFSTIQDFITLQTADQGGWGRWWI